MTLRSALCRTALGLSLLGAGCATIAPGRDSLLSRMSPIRSKDSEQNLADQEEPSAKTAADRRTPERKEPEVRQTSLAAARPAAQQFDPATQMVIDTELRDCPPAERQQWMDLLQTMDPASVPHVLAARRMQASKAAASATRPNDPSTAGGFANGHSPMASAAAAPRLDFEPLDSAGNPPTSSLANRLDAPEPPTSPSPAGVSPFARNADRDVPSMPAIQAGFATRTDARPEFPVQPSSADSTFAVMPAISPNQPGEVPLAPPGSGRIEPLGRLDVMPSAGLPPLDPNGGALSSSMLQGAYWQDTLQRLTSLVETEIAAAHPGLSEPERLDFIKQQVWLRMLYLMAEQPERAQSAIPGIDPAEQEFWTALFWAVSNYFDQQMMPNSGERIAQTLEQLDYAQGRLQRLAALKLDNVNFCYKINSFGNFESWQRDEFRPGQRILLYAELSNFESRPDSQGLFATRIRSEIEIRRGPADGEIVDQKALPITEDACHSIRRDYFHSYTIDLPQHLKPGPYTLILRVEDEFSAKTAVHPISFLIR